MKALHQSVKLLMFFILLFGIFTVTNGLKPIGKTLLGIMVLSCLVPYALTNKRQLVIDIFFLFVVFLMAIPFINSIYYLVRPPITAADCEGHQLMDFSWMTGVYLAPVMTIILAVLYFKTDGPKNIIDKVFAWGCILVFIFALWNPQWVEKTNKAIDLFFKVDIVLPKGY